MDQNSMDWTAFLAGDDIWYLPEPEPIDPNAEEQPTDDFSPWPSFEQLLQCDQHPHGGTNCCWRRSLNDPFIGTESQIASLGHFGVGFPDGYQPATVPGSFTCTAYERGESRVLDNNILDNELSFGGTKGVPVQSIEDEPRREDASGSVGLPDGRSLDAQHETETLRRPYSLSQGDMMPAFAQKNSGVRNTENNLPAFGKDEPPTFCSTTTAPAQCPTVRESAAEHESLALLAQSVRAASEGIENWASKPSPKVVRAPRKYRKRLTQKLSAEFVSRDDEDSDSDYTPDTNTKKRARIASVAIANVPAKKRQVARLQKVWRARPNPGVAKRRAVATTQQSIARETRVETADTITDYAPKANKAHFAATAKRARFALKATITRPQADFTCSDIEIAQEAFGRLYEAFDEKKRLAAGMSSSRNVQEAVFADTAVEAVFARDARNADIILQLG